MTSRWATTTMSCITTTSCARSCRSTSAVPPRSCWRRAQATPRPPRRPWTPPPPPSRGRSPTWWTAGDGATGRARLVQGRGLLRGPRQGVHGRQRRRRGRLRGAHRAARLRPGAWRRLPLDPADVSLAAPRRWLRHRRLLRHPSLVRDGAGLPEVPRRRPRARPARHRRPRHKPHLRPAPVVPGLAIGSVLGVLRLLRLEPDRPSLPGRARHLRRYREVELDARPGARRVLLASLLQPPARSELRQPRGAPGEARRHALLARPGPGRLSLRRGAVPGGARGDELREPARDARDPKGF